LRCVQRERGEVRVVDVNVDVSVDVEVGGVGVEVDVDVEEGAGEDGVDAGGGATKMKRGKVETRSGEEEERKELMLCGWRSRVRVMDRQRSCSMGLAASVRRVGHAGRQRPMMVGRSSWRNWRRCSCCIGAEGGCQWRRTCRLGGGGVRLRDLYVGVRRGQRKRRKRRRL
jgi:hypothetical protein